MAAYTTSTKSDIGKGACHISTRADGAYMPIGNVSAATLTSEEDKKTHMRHHGGIKGTISLTINNFSPENLVRALRAAYTDAASAAVVDESHANVKAGFLIATDFIYDRTAALIVKKGETTLTAGVDYTLVPAGIQLVVGGAVVTGDDLTISYTKGLFSVAVERD